MPGLGLILTYPASFLNIMCGILELFLIPVGAGVILGLLDGALMVEIASGEFTKMGPLERLVVLAEPPLDRPPDSKANNILEFCV